MTEDPALAAVKTYRYLRFALVGLVLLLFSAVAVEWWAAGRACLQGSISAYFYTPARGVFVGVLVTMGVCLIALKGNTPWEDVLLNFAGMLAPGVAFVPTPGPGECRSVPLAADDVASNVANNMQALFVAGAAAAVVAVTMAGGKQPGSAGLATPNRIGLVGTAVVLSSGAAWFYVDRESFVDYAHGVAAVPMFIAIVAVVWLNGRDAGQSANRGTAADPARYVRVYRGIAVLMLGSLAAVVGISLLTGSTSVVLWVEVVLITLFAAFWVVQTVELWSKGLRRGSPGP
jgi:hypothetical protein